MKHYYKHSEKSQKEPMPQSFGLKLHTCLDCVNNSTRWPCCFHNLNNVSTTTIFPERFQNPYPFSNSTVVSFPQSRTDSLFLFSSRFSGGLLNIRSGWLQIFRSLIRPTNIYRHRQHILAQCCISIPPGKVRKPLSFWRFQEV